MRHKEGEGFYAYSLRSGRMVQGSNERSRVLLNESHKLDPQPLDGGPRPKIGKLRLNRHGTILKVKAIGSDLKSALGLRVHPIICLFLWNL